MPEDWATWIDEPHTETELAAIRRNVAKGTPYGSEQWVTQTAARLGLASTLRPRGRPGKYLA
jgi:putative transposase